MSRSKLTDALKGLGSNAWDKPQLTTAASEQKLDIALIDPAPNQPRKKFNPDKLKELAASIAEHGLQQPVGVRVNPDKPGRYYLTFGERRLRACKDLGHKTIDVIVREVSNKAAVALIENLQREDLTPWEIATALHAYGEEYGKKASQIATDLGKSNSYVSEHLATLRMPEEFQEALQGGVVNDVRTLNDAFALAKQHPGAVSRLLVGASAEAPVTRDMVNQLKAKLRDDEAPPKSSGKAGAGKADPGAQSSPGDGDNQGAGTTAASSALPRIYVSDLDGNEIGYIDFKRERKAGGAHIIRDGNGLNTWETFDQLRILRIDDPT